ncbi:hypothetical protein T484DRAFT_1847228 [Baffinella frigidus]|nr:hypothetical protein T484DRAFT_1847228 [Cryptophyta sp. CCMP2293]
MVLLCLQSSLDACLLTAQVAPTQAVKAAGLPTGLRGVEVRAVVAKGETFAGTHAQALVAATQGALAELARQEGGATREVVAVVAQPSYWALAVAGAGGAWEVDQALRFASDLAALRAAGLVRDDCPILPKAVTAAPARRVVAQESTVEEATPADLLGWEGTLRRLSAPQECFRLDFSEPSNRIGEELSTSLRASDAGSCHALVLHAEALLGWGDAKDTPKEAGSGGGLRISGEGCGAAGFVQGLLMPSEVLEVASGVEVLVRTRLLSSAGRAADPGHADARGESRLVLAFAPATC